MRSQMQKNLKQNVMLYYEAKSYKEFVSVTMESLCYLISELRRKGRRASDHDFPISRREFPALLQIVTSTRRVQKNNAAN